MNDEQQSPEPAKAAATPATGAQLSGPGRDEEVIAHVVSVSGAAATAAADEKMTERLKSGGEEQRLHIGSAVRIQVGEARIYAAIRSVRLGDSVDGKIQSLLEVEFLAQAELDDETGEIVAKRGIRSHPMPGDPVYRTTDEDLELLYSAKGMDHVEVGTVYPSHRVPANILIEPLMTRHFAVLGSTGTGKSTALALFVHRIVEALPHGHIIILDPHNEYKGAFKNISVHFDTENLALPYWLMNLEEMTELLVGKGRDDAEESIDILRKALLVARKKGADRHLKELITVDSPTPYRMSDLLGAIDDAMGQLNKPEAIGSFMRLKNKLEELRSDRRYGFMFSGLLVSDSLVEIVSRMLRLPGDGKPVTTLDLSGIPADIVDVVVSVLCRIVFDFALWTKRDDSQPVMLICEEAHRYVPAIKMDKYGAARGALERIAKEGRKYGVSLGLVSQRPSDLSEAVLSQCGTIISMRMNNDRDRKFVESTMPEGSKGFLESLPSLQNREAIISGEGVTAPVRVLLSYLEEDKRPSSQDPAFSEHWSKPMPNSDFVHESVARWRSQAR